MAQDNMFFSGAQEAIESLQGAVNGPGKDGVVREEDSLELLEWLCSPEGLKWREDFIRNNPQSENEDEEEY